MASIRDRTKSASVSKRLANAIGITGAGRSRVFAALFAALWGSAAHPDTLAHIATFTWSSEVVVGLSGLEVSGDGATFQAIGDRGWYLSGTFEREGERIVGLKIEQLLPILGNEGQPVAARRVGDWSDAEGLAIAPDGTMWISFERWAHVARYAGPEQSAQWIKDHDSFYDYRDNRQLEALAVHPDGTVFTFPEQPASDGFPIYRLDDDVWSISGHIEQSNGFAIVGADFDSDGRLYLLERKLILGLWWQSRVRRLDVDLPQDIEVLWTSHRAEYYNIEGIAVWGDDLGPRLTLVSDNNADQDEPTQFIEFRVEPAE